MLQERWEWKKKNIEESPERSINSFRSNTMEKRYHSYYFISTLLIARLRCRENERSSWLILDALTLQHDVLMRKRSSFLTANYEWVNFEFSWTFVWISDENWNKIRNITVCDVIYVSNCLFHAKPSIALFENKIKPFYCHCDHKSERSNSKNWT